MAIDIFGTEPRTWVAVPADTYRGHDGKDGNNQPSVRPSVLNVPEEKGYHISKHFLHFYNIQYVNEDVLHHK